MGATADRKCAYSSVEDLDEFPPPLLPPALTPPPLDMLALARAVRSAVPAVTAPGAVDPPSTTRPPPPPAPPPLPWHMLALARAARSAVPAVTAPGAVDTPLKTVVILLLTVILLGVMNPYGGEGPPKSVIGDRVDKLEAVAKEMDIRITVSERKIQKLSPLSSVVEGKVQSLDRECDRLWEVMQQASQRLDFRTGQLNDVVDGINSTVEKQKARLLVLTEKVEAQINDLKRELTQVHDFNKERVKRVREAVTSMDETAARNTLEAEALSQEMAALRDEVEEKVNRTAPQWLPRGESSGTGLGDPAPPAQQGPWEYLAKFEAALKTLKKGYQKNKEESDSIRNHVTQLTDAHDALKALAEQTRNDVTGLALSLAVVETDRREGRPSGLGVPESFKPESHGLDGQ